MIKIIDASVAIKWFTDELNGKDLALEILAEIEQNPKVFAVPELFFCEMVSVLCKLAIPEEKILEYLRSLQDLGLHRIGNGSELLALAAQLALRYHLTGYDAIYVACAKLTSGRWITFDDKAHSKIKSLKISQCLYG